jgi:hypothetical protein
MSDIDDHIGLEHRRLKLEESRFRSDVVKWAIVALGAVVSFYVIDVGKLRLEEFRSRAENQRALLQSYLTATESVQPDIWKRKLRVLQTFSDDQRIRTWAGDELVYIENFAALDALYRETLKVASQLVSQDTIKDPQRQVVRARYEQLYWADLPFAKESDAVAQSMVAFRTSLVKAEENPKNTEAWHDLDISLITLSQALRDSQPGKTK